MIFDQMEFHNVEAMVWEEDGYKMSRLPRDVAKQLDQGIRDNTSFLSTGVEVRFRLTGEEVKLHLRADPDEEAQTVLIYYGSFQGGWQYSAKALRETETVISVKYPEELENWKQLQGRQGFLFHPGW